MPSVQKITPEIRSQIETYLSQGLSQEKIATMLGIGKTSVGEVKRKSGIEPPTPATTTLGQSEEMSETEWKITIPRTRICTLDQLVDHCKIDLETWQIDKFHCNKWEVGIAVGDGDKKHVKVEPLFQVKAFLSKKVEMVRARQQIEELKKEALKYSPKFIGFKPKKTSGSGNIAEFSVYDHHFGSLVWGKETDGPDWDNAIAMKTWKAAFESLVDRVRGFKPEGALLVLGNDQQNSDNRAGMTEGLTPQIMDSRYQRVFQISKQASLWAIDKLLAEYGSVHVVVVPGNHDVLSSFLLGDIIATWYRHCPGVTVDNSIPTRKYFEHGTTMLLFTHGNKGRLEDYDRVMATERPEMWGRCKWREAHTGDKHHRKVIEQKGATIRILPSLRPSCAWSYENHHIGSIRAAEAYVWSKTDGLVGTATYAVLNETRE